MSRRTLLLAALPLAALVAVGLARLRIDVDVFNLLPRGSATVEGLGFHQRAFAGARELLLSVEAPDPAAAEAAAAALARALEASPHTSLVVWRSPLAGDPALLGELLAFAWLNRPPERFAAMAERLAPGRMAATVESTLERIATSLGPAEIGRLSRDPFALTDLVDDLGAAGMAPGRDPFASADGRLRLLFLTPPDDEGGFWRDRRWLAEVDRFVRAWTASAPEATGVEVRITGNPAFVAAVGSGLLADIRFATLGTFLLVGGLFWLVHRRWAPLGWLLALLVGVLAATAALGGALLGPLNAVALGFAAILLGLAADYGLILYQEHFAHPGRGVGATRRAVAPSILWAAATTAGAFAMVGRSSLPGLTQLGTLVAIGIVLAAGTMVVAYLPLLAGRAPRRAQRPAATTERAGRATRRVRRPAATTEGAGSEARRRRARRPAATTEGAGRATRRVRRPAATTEGAGSEARRARRPAATTSEGGTGHAGRRPPEAGASSASGTPPVVGAGLRAGPGGPGGDAGEEDAARSDAGADGEPWGGNGSGSGSGNGSGKGTGQRIVWAVTGLLLAAALAVLAGGMPAVDYGTDRLGPRDNPAREAMAEIQRRVGGLEETLLVLVSGADEAEVADRLEAAERALAAASAAGPLASWTLPTALWPHPAHQAANLSGARSLAERLPDARRTALAAGFRPDALRLTAEALSAWGRFAAAGTPVWPERPTSRWLVGQLAARDGGGRMVALGRAEAAPGASPAELLGLARNLHAEVPGLRLVGWQLLSESLLGTIGRDVRRVLVPAGAVLLVLLALTFRRAGEVVLALAGIAFGLACLLALMRLLGWSWNLMNVTALPLLFGAGVDYSIHMQLALQRYAGDLERVWGAVGRAVLLCGASTASAFATLGLASNAGLASLGRVAAAGIAVLTLVAVGLLPAWWLALERRRAPRGAG